MLEFHWSQSEKKFARALFDRTVENELAEIVSVFKKRAAAATSPDDVWHIAEDVIRIRNEFDYKYIYRYSKLILVFARLLREKRICEQDLEGLAEDKQESIRGIASYSG